MNKAIKRIAMLFMGCGFAVSVSMGAYIPKSDEENYQKLKAELEKIEQGWYEGDQITCSYSEDGEVIIDSKYDFLYRKKWCELKNVLAFFDEIRAMEVKVDKKKGEREFYVAINKVREMPRFKEDSGIYLRTRKIGANESILGNSFWISVFQKLEETNFTSI